MKIYNKLVRDMKEDTIKLGSSAEDLFIEVFSEVFGPENTKYLFIQYPFVDIYGKNRFIDFALQCENENIAIEIDGETYHNPNKVSDSKYYDDLLKQNSPIYNDIYIEQRRSRDFVKWTNYLITISELYNNCMNYETNSV